MSKELSLQETGAMLLAAEKIVLCTHVSPDGDTLGSTLGLARFLLAQGKQVTVFCDDVINKSFSFFPGIELCERPVEGSKLQTDLLVVIDASSFDRIGLVSEVVEAKTLLNIDHHISNERFADYLYLDAKAAAVGEVMCDLFMAMQWPFDKEIATCFYTAISTDCGSFRYANTTPKTMRNAAKLLEYGVQPNEISDALDVRSRDTVEMLAKVLPSLTFAYEGKIAYLTITNDLYDKDVQTDSFVSYPRYIEGVDVAIMFKAVEPAVTRVSMRSKSVDVSAVAVAFGGGGHLHRRIRLPPLPPAGIRAEHSGGRLKYYQKAGQTAVCPELHFYGKSQDGKRQLTFVLFSISSRWRRTSRPAMRARPRSGGVPAARTPCGGNRSAKRPAPCPARLARWER